MKKKNEPDIQIDILVLMQLLTRTDFANNGGPNSTPNKGTILGPNALKASGEPSGKLLANLFTFPGIQQACESTLPCDLTFSHTWTCMCHQAFSTPPATLPEFCWSPSGDPIIIQNNRLQQACGNPSGNLSIRY